MLPLLQHRIELGFLIRSQLHYQLSQTLSSLMAVLAYTSGFSALMWMNTEVFRLTKVYSEVPEDSAFISSKSRFHRC